MDFQTGQKENLCKGKMQPYYVIEYVITDMIILQHWISRQNISYTKEDINSFC